MNCANHPEAAASAFCQNCGKPLCSECVRTVQGNVFCEPCLAARVTGAPAGFPPGPPLPGHGPNPGTATILGFIPGVGAMYNGQYIKAIIHVLVFVVLIGISEHYGLFGIFLAIWVLYQVFDAHQTAKARRDGLPLPDPFGLNELGNRIGGHTPPPVGYAPPPPASAPGAPGSQPSPQPGYTNPDWAEQVRRQTEQWGQQAGQWGEQLRGRIVAETVQSAHHSMPWNPGVPPVPPAPGVVPPPGTGYPPPPGAGYSAGYGAGYPPPPPPPGWTPMGAVPPPGAPQMELERARREPIGAIILILLGMLFLFNTLGFFSFGWISHGWPWVIVGLAVWLLMRNSGRLGFVGRVGPHPGQESPPPVHPPQPPGGGAL